MPDLRKGSSSFDAIKPAEDTMGEIHLLLCEVDLREMSGPDIFGSHSRP